MTDSKNVLDIDNDTFLDGELASQIDERGRATVYVQLPDGTEDTFFVNEKNMRRAGYYFNTPVGTKMRFLLGRDMTTNRIFVHRIERNKNTPPRLDARTLPWLRAVAQEPMNLDKPFYFINVLDSCDFFNGPTEIHVTSRLIRNSGYEEGFTQGQEIKVRVAVGEAGLGVVAIWYPEGFKNPGRQMG